MNAGALLVWVWGLAVAAQAGVCADRFVLLGDKNIMDEEHFGIAQGMATIGIPYRHVGGIQGFWSPPWASSDFAVETTIDGETWPSQRYAWRYGEVECAATKDDIEAVSKALLIPNERAGIVALTLSNRGTTARTLPVTWKVQGTLDSTPVWEFARTLSKTVTAMTANGPELRLVQGEQAIVVRADAAWELASGIGKTTVLLEPGAQKTVYVGFAVGRTGEAAATCERILSVPAQTVSGACAALDERVCDLFKKLPVLESDNASLTAFYNRSMVHLLMNQWDLPDFVLHPCYTTGSVKGGCVCDYLWDYGEMWEILPLYDPASVREHVKQFLKTDLVTHFAFMPTTGEAFGPWYMVNQEKIIGSVYYYVKNTGDVSFLREETAGKTILDWMLFHAYVLDDVSKPVALIDYGPSNSHLELRRGFPYNHVMPDLNGRRYANYLMTAALCDWAGKPVPELRERAEALKKLLKERLWDAGARWFRFEDGQGHAELRYTMQMYKLFSYGVLDAEEEAGLLSHMNENEFLSEYGFHSMSKTDIAYDQVDIDNGGGGAYTSFPPQIAERFYKSGHVREADDILKRILWWGERMPYWGDSLVANAIDYRKDTPLQCTIGGTAIAQSIIFGLFGVDAYTNGDIAFKPHRPSFAEHLALRGVRLHGVVFDIKIDGDTFEVSTDDKRVHGACGSPVFWRAAQRQFGQTE